MKKIKSIVGIVILMVSLLLPQITVLAQPLSDLSPQVGENYISSLNPESLTSSARLGNCFDIYNIVNVEVNINLDNIEYQPADVLIFNGSVQNNNPYPLPELAVKANIFKIEQEGENRVVKTVDEFIVADNINLTSLGTFKIDAIYNLPINAVQGDYEVTFSIVQDNQIHIAGLSFADEAPSLNLGFSQFTITGDKQEKVSIIQNQIMINDQAYNNVEPNPIYSEANPATIKVPIQNNTNDSQKVEVSYEVFSWSDDLGETGRVREVLNQELEIAGNSRTDAVYTLENIKEAVYYVKVTVSAQGEYSNITWDNIANIRVTYGSIMQPRIAFTGLNTSPYSPEKNLELVTCIHNVNEGEVNGILENTVRDDRGRIIAQSQYSGKIAGKVNGIYTPLPQNKTYNKLIVTSIMKDSSGNIIDSIELIYDCQNLDSSQCKNNIQDTGIWVLFITLISLTGLIFLGLKLYTAKRIKV